MLLDLDVPRSAIPFFANWTGVWAIHAPAARALAESIGSISVARHLATVDPDAVADARERSYDVVDRIAIINVDGPILKHRSSFGGSCSTVELRRLVRRAVADENVDGICLRIESPGGSVAGTPEAFEEIAKASKTKPTMAYAEDLCASAGYWLAVGCDRIVANEPARVGSIGVYTVVADSSAAAAQAGVVVHVVGTGEHKGAGEPGTPITDAQLEHWRAEIEGLNALFLRAVGSGRNLDEATVKSLADGRCHLATTALELGLIDAVGSFEAALNDFRVRLDGAGPSSDADPEADPSAAETESAAMSAEAPATVAQLSTAFPKSSAEWRLRCIERGLTLSAATAEYSQHLEAQNDALRERLAVAGKRKPGHSLAPPKKRKTAGRHRAEDVIVDEEEDDELLETPPSDAPPMDPPPSDGMPEEDDEESMDEEESPSIEDEEDSIEARFHRAYAVRLKAHRGDRIKALKALNRERPSLVAGYRHAKAAAILRARKRNARRRSR